MFTGQCIILGIMNLKTCNCTYNENGLCMPFLSESLSLVTSLLCKFCILSINPNTVFSAFNFGWHLYKNTKTHSINVQFWFIPFPSYCIYIHLHKYLLIPSVFVLFVDMSRYWVIVTTAISHRGNCYWVQALLQPSMIWQPNTSGTTAHWYVLKQHSSLTFTSHQLIYLHGKLTLLYS